MLPQGLALPWSRFGAAARSISFQFSSAGAYLRRYFHHPALIRSLCLVNPIAKLAQAPVLTHFAVK
jgi:hypothetical protein